MKNTYQVNFTYQSREGVKGARSPKIRYQNCEKLCWLTNAAKAMKFCQKFKKMQYYIMISAIFFQGL